MLTKEKLSEIFNKAIGTRNYVFEIEQSMPKNSYSIKLYDDQHDNDGFVAYIYIYEGNMPGLFKVNFVPLRSDKTDRKMLRMINNQLYCYFDKKLEPKYRIKVLNNDYIYLALDEDEESWNVTTLDVANSNHQKTIFTADEIRELSWSEKFPDVDLWCAPEEIEE